MTTRMWTKGALAALAAGTVLFGCQFLTDPLADPPDFEGTVSSLHDGNRMWLTEVTYHWDVPECVPGQYCHCEPGESCPRQALIHFRDGPSFYIEHSGRLRRASVDDIKAGDRVQVWTTGAEMRSGPPQYIAVQVVIGQGSPE